MTKILFDVVPFHNECGAQSENVYCKRKIMEVVLGETPRGIKGEHLFKMVPSGKSLPCESKVRRNLQSSSVQQSSSENKLRDAPMDKSKNKSGHIVLTHANKIKHVMSYKLLK